MSKWEKRGLIYATPGDLWWARGYTHTPTVEIIDRRTIRVYFAALDDQNFGRIGYADLDIEQPSRVLQTAASPILDLGELGCFDDSGVVPSCVVNVGTRRYLYYIGFQRTVRVPYMLFTGLAVDSSQHGFTRYSVTPILDRTNEERFSRSGPFVIFDEGTFKMWYWSCRHWVVGEEGVHYSNSVRYATSADGIVWQTNPHVCLEPEAPDEYSIGRPCVLRHEGGYRMWYSVRSFSRRYFIGYAESRDGINWERRIEEGPVVPSATGWDAEMVCYPYVIEINGRLLMFYNGNQHGRSGFGYAELRS